MSSDVCSSDLSAGEDVALHTGRDLLVNLVVVDLSETGTSPLPERPLREAQVATAAHLVNHLARNCLVIGGHLAVAVEPDALRFLEQPTELGFAEAGLLSIALLDIVDPGRGLDPAEILAQKCVVWGTSVSVRVALGGCGFIKKKKT